jgi:hypothetical protein
MGQVNRDVTIDNEPHEGLFIGKSVIELLSLPCSDRVGLSLVSNQQERAPVKQPAITGLSLPYDFTYKK